MAGLSDGAALDSGQAATGQQQAASGLTHAGNTGQQASCSHAGVVKPTTDVETLDEDSTDGDIRAEDVDSSWTKKESRKKRGRGSPQLDITSKKQKSKTRLKEGKERSEELAKLK